VASRREARDRLPEGVLADSVIDPPSRGETADRRCEIFAGDDNGVRLGKPERFSSDALLTTVDPSRDAGLASSLNPACADAVDFSEVI
jgi:hypothetical protein